LNANKSSEPMTKQRPCATSLPPSRLCRLLILTFVVKLTVLGMIICEPGLPDFFPSDGTAVAATEQGAAATPSLEATLPDAGMSGSAPAPASAQTPPAPGTPLAVPGVSTPAVPEENNRALPFIQTPPRQAGPAVGNATQNASALAPDARDALARRQEDLARKEQELRVLERELAERLERMQILENRLAEMIKDAEQAGDAKFRHLVDVLSNMKAKQAAAVLETLDPKIAVRVLAGMRGRQAGEILTFVKPEIAAKLTEALARMQLPLQ
jgi:flagellar motility protein MotE (MotC chaperone)